MSFCELSYKRRSLNSVGISSIVLTARFASNSVQRRESALDFFLQASCRLPRKQMSVFAGAPLVQISSPQPNFFTSSA
jgi:hypothetical protein